MITITVSAHFKANGNKGVLNGFVDAQARG